MFSRTAGSRSAKKRVSSSAIANKSALAREDAEEDAELVEEVEEEGLGGVAATGATERGDPTEAEAGARDDDDDDDDDSFSRERAGAGTEEGRAAGGAAAASSQGTMHGSGTLL